MQKDYWLSAAASRVVQCNLLSIVMVSGSAPQVTSS